jgi:hypothetical protein
MGTSSAIADIVTGGNVLFVAEIFVKERMAELLESRIIGKDELTRRDLVQNLKL